MLNKFSLKATAISGLWLLSFMGSFLLLPFADVIEVAGVITLLCGLMGYVYIKGDGRLHFTALSILMLALWGVAANSVLWSEAKSVSLVYFFFFSAFPLTFFLFSFKKKAEILLTAVGAIIFAIGLINITQFFFYPSMLKFGGTYWPFEDNNSLSALLGVGILIFLGQAFRGGKASIYYTLAAIILCAAVISTSGRALLLGLLLVVPLFSWLVKPASYKPLWLFTAGFLILFASMTTAEINLYHFVGGVSETTQEVLEEGLTEPNSLSGKRWMIWEGAASIFATHPWAGTGIGTFFLYYPEVRQLEENSAGYQAHNDLLQFAAEMGWAAPVLALAMVGFVIAGTMRAIRQLPTGEKRIVVLTAFAIFGLFIGHSLVNFNMYVLPSLMVLGLCLAIWNSYLPSKDIGGAVTRKTREMVAFAAILIFLIPLWAAHLSEYYTGRAVQSLAHQDIAGFADNLNQADTWAMGMNARATLQGAKFAAATNHSERALDLLEKAEAYNPRLEQIYTERANLLRGHDNAKALAEAETALRLDKTSLNARMLVSDILADMGRKDEAYDVLKLALDMDIQDAHHQSFFEGLAARAIERGDPDTSTRALQKARAREVDKPSGLD